MSKKQRSAGRSKSTAKAKAKIAKPVNRTDSDRLRSLLAVTTARPGERWFTQKELAAELGISTRTLRRIKNIAGYEPSPKTLARIHKPLVREDQRVRRKIQKTYNLPKTKTFALPHIYPSKAKPERTLAFDVEAWTTEQKIDFLTRADRAGRYIGWRATVKTPLGVGYVPGRGFVDVDEDDDEPISDYFTIGPFAFIPVNRSLILEQITENDDAGREVVTLFLIENLNPKQPKKRTKGKRK